MLRGTEDGHMLPHGVIVGIDTPRKPAPVFFEIFRQELHPMVRGCADLLPSAFKPHKGGFGISTGLFQAAGRVHGAGGNYPAWAISEPGLLHGSVEILH